MPLSLSRRLTLAAVLLTGISSSTAAAESPSLRAPSGASATTRTQDENKGRALQEGVITKLESGEGVHVVTIAQTMIGVCNDADPATVESADVFMATWLDPDTLEETCGFKKWGVNACFQETVTIGCDPETHTATVNVYVKDAATFSPPWKFVVDNPLIGNCRFGYRDKANKIVHITETFPCLPDAGPGGPATCGEDYDECLDGTYCNQTMEGYECKSYVPAGSRCAGYTVMGGQNVCDPTANLFCKPSGEECFIPDIGGTCTILGGDCSMDKDCNIEGLDRRDSAISPYWCDQNISKCKKRLPLESCCNPDQDQCEPGLECKKGGKDPTVEFQDYLSSFNVCRYQAGTCSVSHNRCGDNAYCGFSEKLGYVCKAYIEPGGRCGGFTIPGEQGVCNPDVSFCYDGETCWNPLVDGAGRCVAYGANTCRSIQDCDGDGEWCDMMEGRCKQGLVEDGCCNIKDQNCADGMVCATESFPLAGQQDVCRVY